MNLNIIIKLIAILKLLFTIYIFIFIIKIRLYEQLNEVVYEYSIRFA
jgi:hypothetical protein